jgi:hypothetical protein
MYKSTNKFFFRLLSDVCAVWYKRSESDVAGLSPSFATIGDEKVRFSYEFQQNYTQRTYRETQLYSESKQYLGKRHGTHH